MKDKDSQKQDTSASAPSAKQVGWSTMNIVFVLIILMAVLTGGASGSMRGVSDASFQAAKDAVTLALSLIGIMGFWLGMMRVLEAGGLVTALGRLLQPILAKLFPEIPPGHPALGAMVMNISANMIGLGNAATPFGLRAMTELNRLNPLPGTATNAMCLFLAINTSSVTLLPLGAIGVRAAAGSQNPAAIFLPTLLATICSTVTGVLVAIYFAKRDRKYLAEVRKADALSASDLEASEINAKVSTSAADYSHLRIEPALAPKLIGWGALLAALILLVRRALEAESFRKVIFDELLAFWLMPLLILAIACYALIRGIKIYDAVTEGAKQGFEIAVKIIPFLVTILVAIAMFRASGAMEALIQLLSPLTTLVGMPPETLPMAIIRPLSGTGAFAVMSELIKQGPDSYPAFVASVMNGAADTTFYILAVYFGSVGVFRVRHAVIAGIAADVVGMVGACVFSQLLFPLFTS